MPNKYTSNTSRRSLVLEVSAAIFILWLITISPYLTGLPVDSIEKYYNIIITPILIGVPLIFIHRRGGKIDFLDHGIHSYLKSLLTFLITAIIVIPLYLLAIHSWAKIMSAKGPMFVTLPQPWKVLTYNFIITAIPEEFFNRGYIQSMLNQVFPKKWHILGADLGWAWIITAVIFTVFHKVLDFRLWQFGIFFIALVLGYLREKTGTITASILLHAVFNIVIVEWFLLFYKQ